MSDGERAEDLLPVAPRAGERLRAAREARGMTLEQVAERTRVPLRHLETIEGGSYADLPSPTYATGFARAYARAVGEDEVAVAAQVRAEAARLGRRQPEYEPYVTADPARLPSRGLAIVAAGVAVAVLVLAVLWLGSGWLGSRTAEVASPATVPVPEARPAPAANGVAAATTAAPRQVVLTAQDAVWLRVYDAANKTLFIGTMKPGDRFDVPQGADHPQINVGRPDKLAVTLDGKAVPPLGSGERPIKDVAVDASAIAARLAGTPLTTSGPSPTATAAPLVPAPAPSATAAGRPAVRHATPRRDDGDEVTRANRRSARAAQRGEVPPVPTGTATP